MSPTPVIRRATPHDLEPLAALFDAYRRFYEQPADLRTARAFIGARLGHGDSTILVAEGAPDADNEADADHDPHVDADAAPAPRPLAGFCQLYPTFCSVAAAPILVLYDLFVDPHARQGGVGRALMRAAEAHGRAAGVARLDLSTAHTNATAQALYESLGWQPDTEFRHYSLVL